MDDLADAGLRLPRLRSKFPLVRAIPPALLPCRSCAMRRKISGDVRCTSRMQRCSARSCSMKVFR